jgi:methyl-accepting chemotaxis protein
MVRHSSIELKSTIAQQVVGTRQILNNNEKNLEISQELCIIIKQFEETFEGLKLSSNLLSTQLIEISNGANHVNQIVHNITRIAAQTKMLSLNASIEAARSGQHSQEFTVIAREIKQLATETSIVAQKIEPILQEMQSSVKNGVHQMNMFTQEHIEAMNPEIKLLHENIKCQEQGAHEITQAVVELNSALEKTADYLNHTFDRTNVALQELEHSVETLRSEITQFSLPTQN